MGRSDSFFVTAMRNEAGESQLDQDVHQSLANVSSYVKEVQSVNQTDLNVQAEGMLNSESGSVFSEVDSFQSDDSYYDEDEDFGISCLTKQELSQKEVQLTDYLKADLTMGRE